jgi:hypothetical protein
VRVRLDFAGAAVGAVVAGAVVDATVGAGASTVGVSVVEVHPAAIIMAKAIIEDIKIFL